MAEQGYRCDCTEENVVRGCRTHDARQLDFCEDRATSLSHGTGEEAYEILHQCRHENGHEGHQHSCWLCTFTWYSEAPC